MCGELAPERVRLDVVGESANAVDLDDRDRVPVPGLELLVAPDVDLTEVEVELGAQLGELRTRPLAEMATLRVEDPDRRYG